MKNTWLPMDIYAGIFLALLGGTFWFLSLELTDEAAVFPRIVLATFIFLSAAMAVQGYRTFKKTGEAKNPLAFETVKIPFLMFVFISLYVAAMGLVGFCLASAAFIPGVAFFYKNKKPVHILGATVCLIVFIYVLFVVQLQLVLP